MQQDIQKDTHWDQGPIEIINSKLFSHLIKKTGSIVIYIILTGPHFGVPHASTQYRHDIRLPASHIAFPFG